VHAGNNNVSAVINVINERKKIRKNIFVFGKPTKIRQGIITGNNVGANP
jgi:hypothetical protein